MALKFLPDAIASDVVRKQEIENAVAEGCWTLRPTIHSAVDPRLESVVVSDDIAITYYFLGRTDDSPTLGYRITHHDNGAGLS